MHRQLRIEIARVLIHSSGLRGRHPNPQTFWSGAHFSCLYLSITQLKTPIGTLYHFVFFLQSSRVSTWRDIQAISLMTSYFRSEEICIQCPNKIHMINQRCLLSN
ncbi:hypothetical protein LINGRAHAP2_LOCUS20271 [Linum grandiflorum]